MRYFHHSRGSGSGDDAESGRAGRSESGPDQASSEDGGAGGSGGDAAHAHGVEDHQQVPRRGLFSFFASLLARCPCRRRNRTGGPESDASTLRQQREPGGDADGAGPVAYNAATGEVDLDDAFEYDEDIVSPSPANYAR